MVGWRWIDLRFCVLCGGPDDPLRAEMGAESRRRALVHMCRVERMRRTGDEVLFLYVGCDFIMDGILSYDGVLLFLEFLLVVRAALSRVL